MEKLLTLLALGQSSAIERANADTINALETDGIVHLPSDYKQHDLENFQPTRRRMRGNMTTNVVSHFAAYANTNRQDGAAVFIDPVAMSAKAVLNLGTTDEPGHCDSAATLLAKKTAAYQALREAACGRAMSQQDVAEFFEDWAPFLKFMKDDAVVEAKHAIAAVRKITIEALRKVEAEEQSLSASRSTFESVKATSADPIPTRITFRCIPFAGFTERTFDMRLGVLSSGSNPTVVLRLVNIEAAEEAMAEELAGLVREAFGEGWDDKVLLGTFSAK